MNINITYALISFSILCMLFNQTRKYGVASVSLLCLAYPKIILGLVIIFSVAFLAMKLFPK